MKLEGLLKLIKTQKKLLHYILLSYLDKGIIFLVPLVVLNLFLNKEEYITVEYIYSFSIILIPFLDLGINGYIFYGHRERKQSKRLIIELIKVFEILYIALFTFGALLIIINQTLYHISDYLEFIIIRCLYVMSFGFITSLYRLLNTPAKSLYISLIFNLITISCLLTYYVLSYNFQIELIFIGQGLFIVLLLIRILNQRLKGRININKEVFFSYLKKAILYSWPSIVQVFILMYIANYGKLNVLKKLSVDEGVILSLTQRYAFLVQIMHTSILAFIIKKMFEDDTFSINKKELLNYALFISLAVILVFILININLLYSFPEISLMSYLKVILLIIFYTFIWCFYSYLEIFFSRENKNIYKLYLALLSAVTFIFLIFILDVGFLEKLTISMFISILLPFIVSLVILKKRGYKVA